MRAVRPACGASRDDALPIRDHRGREVGGDPGFAPRRIREARPRPIKRSSRPDRRVRAPRRVFLSGILP
jgi:hypothetical protein